ncbi:guanine nucleotide-binding protein subunit beta-like protein 1 isoform X2 [Phacochoerus africanus]|uniref:guanine nucleotide-binding protein subunit beta-like protein 1 isoform X2 n=1 Tax=Phacochoerus africanus TaxID=41426 RepID=UPI001FD99016|nr:guanine nucleotide-binding protein subunit beta-like protein 1 isoform X2 [Phacochoerus africanus]
MADLPLPPPDPQFVLRGTQSAVHALHFCGGAQGQGCPLLLSGSLRGLVHIWSLQTRRVVATLDGHGGQCVTWLQTLPQGPQLLSQGRDLKLCLWDLAEGRNTVVDSVHLESVGFCRGSILAGGQSRWMLAVPGSGSDEVQILEMPSKTSVCSLKPEAGTRPGMPMCLQLWQANSSPRPLLLAGYEDGSVALWDVSEQKVCSRIACHTEPVMGLDVDSQKARGVSGSAEKVLAVWSVDEQQALQLPWPLMALCGALRGTAQPSQGPVGPLPSPLPAVALLHSTPLQQPHCLVSTTWASCGHCTLPGLPRCAQDPPAHEPRNC